MSVVCEWTQIDWKPLVAIVSPFVAAFLAWRAYLNKLSHERDAELRRERQQLYVKIHAALVLVKDLRDVTVVEKALSPYMGELDLLAPDEVIQGANSFVESAKKALQDLEAAMPTGGDVEPTTNQKISKARYDYFEARKKFMFEMRKDVIRGSRLSTKLLNSEGIAYD